MTDENKKNVLVTGGSRGIGRSTCLKFAKMGMNVVVNYKSNNEAAMNVVNEIANLGSKGLAIMADVANPENVESMFKEISETFGDIDILVNNAGIINDGLLMRMSNEAWNEVITTNLGGAFYCTKAAIRSMLRKRWGRIINVVSVIGIEGNIGQANYAASKGGLIAFSKSIAKEVASRNITVNAVAPGYISTDIVEGISEEVQAIIMSRIAQGRLGSPEEVASLINFLASEDAGYITGEVIRIDGGIEI
ncbi:MAG: 3-oxoacyl-[acyl-carrier-protein] reductase [Dehalococcoidia bacterium]|nr:3-oxoacyl-[acyl-carrier-protein] reductase [Dehalococcoidia bacterium]